MDGTIANCRAVRHNQYETHMIIIVDGYDKDKAKDWIGKKVRWTSPAGKEIKGDIKVVHGGKGAGRAIFEKGMPGEAVGSKVKIE